jgi:uncharacterized membrane protein
LTVNPPRTQAQRVIFIDLARALAALLMVYGHAVSALLAPAYQDGPWYDAWQFQRGLTSSLFLLLSGFAFSIATARHWASHLTLSGALVKRLRRFGLFVLIGYALHLPAPTLAELSAASPERWRSFMAVDVLQLIGVTFIIVQLLVLAVRTRIAFTIVSFALAVAIVLATPAVWKTPWEMYLPPAIAAYLSPAGGSLFPLFPWTGFVLLGAGFGQVYARWGAADLTRFSHTALLLPSAALFGCYLLLSSATIFGAGPGQSVAADFVPGDVTLRWAVCLALLWAIATGTRHISRLPHVFSAVAQETLFIYVLHLCIVYGSSWQPGLVQTFGTMFTPLQMLVTVVVLLATVVVAAYYWNFWKHHRPRLARWASFALLAFILIRFFGNF